LAKVEDDILQTRDNTSLSFNHFYAIGLQSYRIRWNNAKYGLLRRSRQFKVICRYQSKVRM